MAKLNKDYIRFAISLDTNEAKQELSALTKHSAELTDKITSVNTRLADLARAGQKSSDEYKNLKTEAKKLTADLAENAQKIAAVKQSSDLSALSVAELRKRYNFLKKELDNISRTQAPEQFARLRQRIEETSKALSEAQAAAHGLTEKFHLLDKTKMVLEGFFRGIGQMLLNNVVGAFKNAIATITDFEAANSKLAAVLGQTADAVSPLTEQAKELGRTTTASASQVTSLQIELAKLGFTMEEIGGLTPSALKFSKAVGADLASAAAFAGATMRIFGKETSEAEDVLATLAIATTSSALDFNKLEASMSTIGPVANAFGFSLEDTTALLGSLANAGFDASTAATATRNILLNLADSNGKLAQALGQPVKNLDDLTAGLEKLDAEGVDLAQVLELTDKRSVAAFSTFLSATDSTLTLRDSISDCTGKFQEMSDTMGDNASASWAGFQSAVEGLVLKFYGLKGVLSQVYQWGASTVQWLGSLVDAFQPVGTALTYAFDLLVNVVNALGKLIGAMTSFISNTKAGSAVIAGITAAFAAYKLAVIATSAAVKNFIASAIAKITAMKADILATNSATAATKAFFRALMANPIAAVAATVAALTAAIIAYFKKQSDAAREAKKEMEELQQAESEYYVSRKKNLDELLDKARDENLSLQERKKAIDELNRIVPNYNGFIDETTGKYNESAEAVRNYIKELKAEAKFKAYQAKLTSLYEERAEADLDLDRTREEGEAKIATAKAAGRNQAVAAITPMASMGTISYYDPIAAAENGAASANAAAQKRVDEIDGKINALSAKMEEGKADGSMAAPASRTTTATTNAGNGGGGRKSADPTPASSDPVVDTPFTQKDPFESETENYQNRLDAVDLFYAEMRQRVAAAGEENQQIQEATQIFQLKSQRDHTTARLDALKKYLADISNAENVSDEEKLAKQQEIQAQIGELQSKELTQTADYYCRLRELAENANSPEVVKEQHDMKLAALSAEYDAAIAMAEGNADLQTQLEEEKLRHMAELNRQYIEDLKPILADQTKMTEEEYDRQSAHLKKMLSQGLLSEKQYQAEVEKLNAQGFEKKTKGPHGAQEWMKFTGDMLGKAGEIFSTLQQTEISESDAKYDALIAQAKANGEDTTALEQEKENAKLEIQKKYADTQMVIKIAEIAANTAVAIMTALAQMGPIAGPIAAGLMGAMGVVQIAQAVKERNNIKNAKPGAAASSKVQTPSASAAATAEPAKSTPTTTRTMQGYSSGGYTGPGGRYEVAGVVHRGEYVVPMPIMSHPQVADAVGMIESIRLGRMGSAASPSAQGYSDGGYTGEPAAAAAAPTTTGMADMTEAVRGLKSATENIRDIRAYVVYRDIKDTGTSINKARKAFTR